MSAALAAFSVEVNDALVLGNRGGLVFGDGGGDPVGHGADYVVGHICLCGLPAVGSLLGPAVQEGLDAGTFPEAGLFARNGTN